MMSKKQRYKNTAAVFAILAVLTWIIFMVYAGPLEMALLLLFILLGFVAAYFGNLYRCQNDETAASEGEAE